MDLQQIENHPVFRQLASERTRFGAGMSVGMAVAYFTFILTVAFCPQVLGLALWNGTVITWGIPIGVGLIALGFVMTAVYVRRANTRFDHLNQRLMEEVQ